MKLPFEHWRRRGSVSLLAAGALEGDAFRAEAFAARAHLSSCARCRTEHDQARAVLQALRNDPLRGREPEIPLGALVARVNARLDEARRTPSSAPWTPRWLAVAVPAGLAAAVAIVLLGPWAPESHGPEMTASPATAALAPLVSDDALTRLERNVAREHAARYLAEAQDVLVNVAATPPLCRRARPDDSRVDLEAEARRSRELLARRALLVESDEAALMSARPVLDDVSDMLRAVAELEPCSRPHDLLRLQEAMGKRRLLMKMRLMERELLG